MSGYINKIDKSEENLEIIDINDTKKAFLIGLVDAISTMSSIILEEDINKKLLFNDISGCMILSLNFEKPALLVIRTNKSSLEKIVSFMTGIEIDQLKEEHLTDGISEIVNMAAGSAKAKLSNTYKSFNLSSPFCVTGDNMKIHHNNSIETHNYFLFSDSIEIEMSVYYF